MPGLIMEGNIVVQTRINGTGAITHDHGKQHHHHQIGRKADAHEAEHRQQNGVKRHLAGAEPADQFAGHKAHTACADTDDDAVQGSDALLYSKLQMNHRPGNAEERIRQSQRNKYDINHDQQANHDENLRLFYLPLRAMPFSTWPTGFWEIFR